MVDITKLSEIFPKGMEVTETLLSSNVIVALMVAVILAPMAEEIVFRGYIYKSISGYGSKVVASIVSALAFSLMHGNVVQGIYAFLATLLFIYIYDGFDSIYASVFAHIVANASSIFFGSCGVYYMVLKFSHKILLLIICVALFLMGLYRFNTYDRYKNEY
ncbi:MAG: CPBP family intramembrane metalloprotease [Lachnospiraceae bacterium]|nr:CPBP family intramembrane metalloprotease [Lachnospiraceae bacterium]